MLWEIEPGTLNAREANQIVFRSGVEYLPFPLPQKDIEAYLRFLIGHEGLRGVEIVAVFAGDEPGGRACSRAGARPSPGRADPQFAQCQRQSRESHAWGLLGRVGGLSKA